MEIGEQHYTIKQARNEIKHLENELELFLKQKKINYYKTQPGAIKYKEIVTSKINNVFDKFTHYVIKDEEYDTKIYGLQEAILSYQEFIVKEMKRISENGGSELIVFLRDELHMPWEDISKETHYSLRQCHRLYNEAKK